MRRGLALAVALALALAAAACGAREAELRVCAAASLRDALADLAPLWAARGGPPLVPAYGSSSDLARQIVAGAPADLFLSADEAWMDHVAEHVVPGTRRALLANRLVVVAPRADGRAPGSGLALLADPDVGPVSMGETATVPVGKYGRAWLEGLGLWDAVAPRVLPGVDTRAALAAVESGGAPLGIVYATDAAVTERVDVLAESALDAAPRIVYPLAVLRGPDEAAARELADWLAGPEAGAVLAVHGFARAPEAAPR